MALLPKEGHFSLPINYMLEILGKLDQVSHLADYRGNLLQNGRIDPLRRISLDEPKHEPYRETDGNYAANEIFHSPTYAQLVIR